jgi:hypothetical protein
MLESLFSTSSSKGARDASGGGVWTPASCSRASTGVTSASALSELAEFEDTQEMQRIKRRVRHAPRKPQIVAPSEAVSFSFAISPARHLLFVVSL